MPDDWNWNNRFFDNYNVLFQERGTSTEPPPRANFSATANQVRLDHPVVDLLYTLKQDIFYTVWIHVEGPPGCQVISENHTLKICLEIDRERVHYEQSRFFFRYSEGSARARERRREKRGRHAHGQLPFPRVVLDGPKRKRGCS